MKTGWVNTYETYEYLLGWVFFGIIFSTHCWSRDECQGKNFWWRIFNVLMILVLFLLAVDAFLDD